MSAPDSQAVGSRGLGGGDSPRDGIFWVLLAAAVLSRLVWVLWVHPPRAHVFSDMAHYVYRARLVAGLEVEPGMRMMAWQAWGTHALLAIPIALLGPGESALEFAGLIWAGFSAATVVLSYRLAWRVLPGGGGETGRTLHWPAIAVAVAVLVWFPLLSQTGFFISEIPYTFALLATTLAAVRMVQDGEGAFAAGLAGAFAFALRPQSAVFFAGLGLLWALDRRRARDGARGSWSRRVDLRSALIFTAPLLAVLAVSMIRVRVYTGEFGGVAENAHMNLTAGRCHNIVTQSFSSQEDLAAFLADAEPKPDRRVSLPGFRALGARGEDTALPLRPALGGEAINLVGYIGDARVHREIRSRCYAATGWLEQLRYSAVNVSLLWFVARPWPESSDQWAPNMLPHAIRGRDLAAGLMPLGLFGLVFALIGWLGPGWLGPGHEGDPAQLGRRAGLGLCALQLASLLLVTAVFFGTPRLRTPYDPFTLILVAAPVVFVLDWLFERVRAARDGRS